MSDMLEFLSKSISIRSVYPEEMAFGKFVEGRLNKLGFSTRRQYVGKSRFNLFASRGKSPSTLFLCHLDTVAESLLWKSDPFKAMRSGDRVYGLGSYDMKGGIAAMLDAAENTGGKMKVLFTCDEENISKGAWEAATNMQNWFHGIKVAISPEPSFGSGILENAILLGRGGRIVVCVDVLGISSHQAQAEDSVDAIYAASIIINNVGSRLRMLNHRMLGKEFAFVREISGESNGLSIPESAHFEIDMRIVPPTTPASAVARINDLINALKREKKLNNAIKYKIYLKKRDTPYLLPYTTDTRIPEVRRVLSSLRIAYDGRIKLGYGRSVADENVLSTTLKIPVLRVGPSGGNAHTANEWVSIKSLCMLAGAYRSIISGA